MRIQVKAGKTLYLPGGRTLVSGSPPYEVQPGQEQFFLKAVHRGTIEIVPDRTSPVFDSKEKPKKKG